MSDFAKLWIRRSVGKLQIKARRRFWRDVFLACWSSLHCKDALQRMRKIGPSLADAKNSRDRISKKPEHAYPVSPYTNRFETMPLIQLGSTPHNLARFESHCKITTRPTRSHTGLHNPKRPLQTSTSPCKPLQLYALLCFPAQ